MNYIDENSYNAFNYCENDPINHIDIDGTSKYSITAVGIQIEISASFLGFAGEVGLEFILDTKKIFYAYIYGGSGMGNGLGKAASEYFKKNLKFLATRSTVSLTNIKNMFSFNISFSIGVFIVKTTKKFMWPNSYTEGTSTSNSLSIGKGKVYVSKASTKQYKCYGLCISWGGSFGVSSTVVWNTRISTFLNSIKNWLQNREKEIVKAVK